MATSRRSVVKGISWAAPAVAVSAAAPALAVSGETQPYPATPIYRNWFVNMTEVGTTSNCQIVLDATNENSTTLGGNANGFWLDADTPGYGDLNDLTFTTTSTLQGLTWTVTRTDGIGTWSYAGETRNSNGTSTYTFVYSGPTKMEVHVPPSAGADYQVQQAYYTGFDAISSSAGYCGGGRTWTNRTYSTLWGRGPYDGTQTKWM